MNNPTTPIFQLPQVDSLKARWSTPFPTPPQQTSAKPVQSTANTLIVAPNQNNPTTVILFNNSATTQHITNPSQTNLPNFKLTSVLSHNKTRQSHSQ